VGDAADSAILRALRHEADGGSAVFDGQRAGGSMARNFKIGATAVAMCCPLNPIANGRGAGVLGWVSDHMGRERT